MRSTSVTRAGLTGSCRRSGSSRCGPGSLRALRPRRSAGEVSADAVTAITRTIGTALRGVPTERVIEERSRFEAGALHAARTGTVVDVRRAVAGLRVVITPEEVDAAAVAVRDAQFLRFSPVPDGVEVAGFLTTETAAKVLTA